MTHDQPPQQPYPPDPGQPPQGRPPQGQYPPQFYPPYGQQPYQPPPRRRRTGRTILAVAGSVIGAIVVLGIIGAIAGSGSHTVTTGQAGSTTSASTSSAPSAAATRPAQVGSTITLAGNNAGEKMAVTVTRIISNGQPADQYSTPDPGKRFYAVQFRLTDTGSAAYSDSPSNGAAVVDSAGQSYDSTFYDVAGCQSFPGTENIAAAQSGLGCVVFEVPVSAKITKVQFTLDSGFGPQTGQWAVRS